MRAISMTGLVCCAWLVLAGCATAGDFDGSQPLLCVPTDITSCHGAGDCGRMSAEEANLPQFVHVNFKKKTLSGKLEGGPDDSTPIQRVVMQEGYTVLQGIGQGRAWSMVIDHEHGEMSAAIAGDEGGLMVLGACTTTR